MIKLISGYVITASENDYQLKQEMENRDKNGNVVYKTCTYHGSVSDAIKSCYKNICMKLVKETDMTLKEAIANFEKIERDLEEIIPGVFK